MEKRPRADVQQVVDVATNVHLQRRWSTTTRQDIRRQSVGRQIRFGQRNRIHSTRLRGTDHSGTVLEKCVYSYVR